MSKNFIEAFLVTATDPEAKRFKLDRTAVCSIGRDAQNTIVLPDNQVSRNHAIVQCAQTGKYYLTDLGSRNGTFVNQRRVTTPLMLRSGDRITVGSCEFVFQGGDEPERIRRIEAEETVVEFSQRMITVLVADIRDFTGLSRCLSAVRLSEVISGFIRESGTVLNSQGAWAQKYIGDAVMAIWLHKHEQPDVRDMVAVFEALYRLFEVAARMQQQFGLDAPIRIGAGVNTGPACVGNMGSETDADYTALSDAVNFSFRLESATKEIGCDLALGLATYDFLTSLANVGELFAPHTLQLKGYSEPRKVYAAACASVPVLVEELRRKLRAASDLDTRPALKPSGAGAGA